MSGKRGRRRTRAALPPDPSCHHPHFTLTRVCRRDSMLLYELESNEVVCGRSVPAVRAWLGRQGRFTVHFAPTSRSSLYAVEASLPDSPTAGPNAASSTPLSICRPPPTASSMSTMKPNPFKWTTDPTKLSHYRNNFTGLKPISRLVNRLSVRQGQVSVGEVAKEPLVHWRTGQLSSAYR